MGKFPAKHKRGNMSFVIKKAERKRAKIKIGIASASGFGKTYSALLLAKGLNNGDLSKVCIIDTENDSACLYAHLGDYSTLPLEAPYSPERYIEAISFVEKSGFEVCIIDSISHEWEGKGGCLELHQQLGGQFAHWAKITPRHQSFINKILTSDMHIIASVRKKQDYELSKNSNGKTEVTKHGTKEITRDGFEYELSINFEIINDNHLTRASKDRTGLFDGQPEFVISENTGLMIRKWIDSGIVINAESKTDQNKMEPTQELLSDRVGKMIDYLLSKGIGHSRVLLRLNKTSIEQIDGYDLSTIKTLIKSAESYGLSLDSQFPVETIQEIMWPEKATYVVLDGKDEFLHWFECEPTFNDDYWNWNGAQCDPLDEEKYVGLASYCREQFKNKPFSECIIKRTGDK